MLATKTRETKTRNGAVHPPSPRPKMPPPVEHFTVEERQARGIEARKKAPRSSHAGWIPAAQRPDPVALLMQQSETRLPELVPLRFARMAESPFGFFRGSPLIMAHDLATTPNSGIRTQLCGDAHLANFGTYGSPERTLVFDINDFDETLPGPWEWDVKRLAASVVVAGRQRGFPARVNRGAAIETVASYRRHMASHAGTGDCDVWYAHITSDDILSSGRGAMRRRTEAVLSKARGSDSMKALSKLTTVVDGERVITDDPPLVIRLKPESDAERDRLHRMFVAYRRTLQENVRHLLEQYRFVDVARKVVGVGSVGTRCSIALLEGRGPDDPLFLQVKEAQPSVLSGLLPRTAFRNQGQRVVAGQRLLQAVSDILLGWIRDDETGSDLYVRQLRDMKGTADLATMRAATLPVYGGLCGWALANAHARSGDRIAISAYLGRGSRFDEAVADFAERYADQNERDHAALLAAIKRGEVNADA